MKMNHGVIAFLAIAMSAASTHAQAYNFKIATWNVKSASGTGPFTSTSPACPWVVDNVNCTINAYGDGTGPFSQKFKSIAADTGVVAIGIQEGWNCGLGRNLAALVGFTLAAWDGGADGVAL